VRRLVLLAVLVCGCGDRKPVAPATQGAPLTPDELAALTPPAPLGPPSAVTFAYPLHEAYHENHAAADAKYTGKVVTVTMTDCRVVKEGRGYAVVDEWFRQATAEPLVVAAFADGAALKGVRPGLHAVIKGRCAGVERNPAAHRGYVVRLADCELVELVRPDRR
jgi:hypothetical protein